MSEHEYSVVGHSRSKIGMYISFCSGLLAGGAVTFLSIAIAYAKDYGFISVPDVVMWPLTGGAIFTMLFILFDKKFWRSKYIKLFVGIPDIEGVWSLTGRSISSNQDPDRTWRGKIEITQKYEKIFVCLITNQSRSHSISAALVPEGKRFRLIYSYRNQPKPDEKELHPHIGHCELLFEPDLNSAEGSYFNGGGRFTHGSMQLERQISYGS